MAQFSICPFPQPAALNPYFTYENQGIALTSHDAMEPKILRLAERYLDFLDRFKVRYATGTAGELPNELAKKLKAVKKAKAGAFLAFVALWGRFSNC